MTEKAKHRFFIIFTQILGGPALFTPHKTQGCCKIEIIGTKGNFLQISSSDGPWHRSEENSPSIARIVKTMEIKQ